MLISFANEIENLRAGTTTPLDLYRRHAENIAAREGEVKAFAVLRTEGVEDRLAAAGARWAKGAPLSPIDGMVVGVKDVIETIDMPTGQNSPLFEGVQTHRDGASVQALRDAGAIIIGKTETAEMATTEPAPTRNPHDLSRTPGGSSSGSAAAVGAGMLPAALGTQVVGSVLRPASYCGVYGFKPTFGGLNRGGAYDQLSQSCIGVLGASLADLFAVSQAVVERVGGDPGHAGISLPDRLPAAKTPQRLLALETEGWTSTSAGTRAAFAAARERLGAAGIAIADRHTDPAIDALEQDLAEAYALTRRILAWEWRWPLGTYAARDRDALSASLKERMAAGEAMSLADYREALARRAAIRARFEDVLAGFDGAISPAATGAAPKGMPTGDASMNISASLLGVPALGLPVLADEGLPLGLQVTGRADGDADLFAIAGGLARLWAREAH